MITADEIAGAHITRQPLAAAAFTDLLADFIRIFIGIFEIEFGKLLTAFHTKFHRSFTIFYRHLLLFAHQNRKLKLLFNVSMKYK